MSEWLAALRGQELDVHTARDVAQVTGWLDTGNFALNWAISGRFFRGYPLGHTVEIFGDPSTGKSYLIGRAIAMAQAQGGVALLDDTEGAYNLEWMQTLGVDIDNLACECSRTVSDHLDTTKGFIAAYKACKERGAVLGPGLLACDSLALLSTTHELEADFGTPDMTKAKELKKFFRIIGGELRDSNAVYISTNHVIANIGNMWNKRTTGGGGGPKYQSSIRIDLRGVSKLKADGKEDDKEGSDFTGVLVRVFIEKNRLAPPWKRVNLVIPFYQPISPASGLIPVLLELGILESTGKQGMLSYQGKKLGLHAYKSKPMKQEEAAENLLDKIPELLEDADAYLDEVQASASLGATCAVEEVEQVDG